MFVDELSAPCFFLSASASPRQLTYAASLVKHDLKCAVTPCRRCSIIECFQQKNIREKKNRKDVPLEKCRLVMIGALNLLSFISTTTHRSVTTAICVYNFSFRPPMFCRDPIVFGGLVRWLRRRKLVGEHRWLLLPPPQCLQLRGRLEFMVGWSSQACTLRLRCQWNRS